MPSTAKQPAKAPELRRLGQQIVELRRDKALSQEALADRAGISRSYMSGIERGVRNPSVLHLFRIARALRIVPGQLLG